MGRSSSRPPPPPPPPLFERPWVDINWENREANFQFVNNYRPRNEGQQLRILLHGPLGAGKSSFINSVCSIYQGRVCLSAAVNNSTDCCTKKYWTYTVKKDNEDSHYPFVFNDMMGQKNPSRRHKRVYEKDVKKALKGRIKDGYWFNPECSLSKDSPYYNEAPAARDKVNILVCVIDANTANLLSHDIIESLQNIREDARDLGIPQVAILTKIDEACPEIQNDIKKVYQSRTLYEKVQLLSQAVGIPESCIFPVKNYHKEMHLNNEMNALILNTLRRIVEIADDSFSN